LGFAAVREADLGVGVAEVEVLDDGGGGVVLAELV
jgi:hypothetical protein